MKKIGELLPEVAQRQQSQQRTYDYSEETKRAVAGLFAYVSNVWPSFLAGKHAQDVTALKRVWLRELGSFQVRKLEEATEKLTDYFTDEKWPPSAAQMRHYLKELSHSRPEHQMLPPPKFERGSPEVANQEIEKMKALLKGKKHE